MSASLKLKITVDGKEISQETSLPQFVIGRASDCDIIVTGEGISRKHLKITVSSNGYQLEDLKTTYGTFIGTNKIEAGKSYPYDGTLPIFLGSQRVSVVLQNNVIAMPQLKQEVAYKEDTQIVQPRKVVNENISVSTQTIKARPNPSLVSVAKAKAVDNSDKLAQTQNEIQQLIKKGQEIKSALNKLVKEKSDFEIETNKAEAAYQKTLLKLETEEYNVLEALKSIRAFTSDIKDLNEETELLSNKNSQLTEENRNQENLLKNAELKLDELNKKLTSIEAAYTQKMTELSDFEQNLNLKKNEFSSLLNEKALAEEFLNVFESRKSGYESELKTFEETKNKWMTQSIMFNAEMSIKETAIQSVNKALDEITIKNNDLREQSYKLKNEVQNLEQSKIQFENESKFFKDSIHKYESEISELQSKVSEYTSQTHNLKNSINDLQKEISNLVELKNEKIRLDSELSDKKIALSEQTASLENLNNALMLRNKEKENVDATYKKLIDDLNLRTQEKATVESEATRYKNEIQSLLNEKTFLEDTIKSTTAQSQILLEKKINLENDFNTTNNQYLNKEKELKSLLSQIEEKKNQISEFNLNLEELNKILTQTQSKNDSLISHNSNLETEIKNNTQSISELSNKKSLLTTEVASLEESTSSKKKNLSEVEKNLSLTIDNLKHKEDQLQTAIANEAVSKKHKEQLDQKSLELEERIKGNKAAEAELIDQLFKIEESIKGKNLEFETISHRNTHLAAEVAEKVDLEYKDRKSKIEGEIKNMFKSAEMQMAEIRFKANTEIEEEKAKALKEIEYKKKEEVGLVLKNITAQLDLKMKKIMADADGPEKIKSEIGLIVNTVLLNDYMSEAERKKSNVIYAMNEVKQNKNYWSHLALKVVAILITLVSLFVFSDQIANFKTKAINYLKPEKNDAKEYAEAQINKRIKENTFIPEMTPEYKSSFTDNVIYTSQYIEKVTSPEFLNDWSLALNKYFKENLKLKENTIVEYMPIETGLNRMLIEHRKTITVQTEKQIIDRMRKVEDENLEQMAQVVGGYENLKKVLNKHKEFFSER